MESASTNVCLDIVDTDITVNIPNVISTTNDTNFTLDTPSSETMTPLNKDEINESENEGNPLNANYAPENCSPHTAIESVDEAEPPQAFDSFSNSNNKETSPSPSSIPVKPVETSLLEESNIEVEKSDENTNKGFTDVEVNEMQPQKNILTQSKEKNSETLSETSDYYSRSGCSLLTDNEDSTSSTNCSAYTNEESALIGLPEEVIEEERKLAFQTKSEMSVLNANAILLDEKQKEKRYKKLMSLLGKSKEYANYMSLKLTNSSDQNKAESNEVLQNTTNLASSRKRKNSSSNSILVKKKKLASGESEPTYDSSKFYKNEMGLIVSRRQPSILTGGVMRDYQLDGLEWMVALYKNGVNGILADEMGLGKTIQTISFLCHLREKRVYGPHLIIAPLSTLPNWILEFANFAPTVPVALFHGPEEKRDKVMNDFVNVMKMKKRDELPVIITSYEMPLRDKKFLSVVKWCTIIVDEGHRLKNYKCMLTNELKRYKTESRLLLTGTPLQNNLTELWSLLNYLIPEIFDNLPMFEDLFDFSDLTDSEKQNQLIQREKEEQLVTKMHQILEPFLLRRIKADVNISLPAKKEILVYAPLTAEQEQLYKSVLDRSILDEGLDQQPEEELPEGQKRKRICTINKSYSEDWDIDEDLGYIPKLLSLPTTKKSRRVRSNKKNVEYVINLKMTNPHMMLRKIVNHPYLVKTPVVCGTREIVIEENMIQQSGKLLVLDALLPRLKAGGHKVLLFSTFTIMLDLIEDYAIIRDYKYVRLDGRCKIDDRLQSIKQFNTDPNLFLFLISTRAGGLGINLTAADTVIIYNSDWNPQVDLQAQDRCHRIGQTKPVIVYRLVSAGTVDEGIVNTATSKRRLEKLVVKKGKFKKQVCDVDQVTLSELRELMMSTDYKQVIHPNGLVLSDEQIESLLDRSDLLEEAQSKQEDKKSSRKLKN